MQYIHDTNDFKLNRRSVVTLGKFDGVHLGHQKLVQIVRSKAEEYDALAAAFTFDHIPLSLCPSVNQHFITTNSERRSVMERLGIDVLVEYPFTRDFMNMEPEDFLKNVVLGQMNACCIVVGTDYTFGRERLGNAEMIAECSKRMGYEAIIVEKERYGSREISSTYVREELKVGHMETVNMLLGRPYSISGVVAKGSQLGRTMDIPTINIYPPAGKLLPQNGVYASVTRMNGCEYYGVTNVGVKPTVKDTKEVSVETYLFDYEDDAYGNNVEIELRHFQRPETRFDSRDALKRQMEADAAFARELFLLS